MRDTDLFQMALGLLPPWMVARSTFDAAAKRLDIHLDFPKGSRFVCPNCGASDCPTYDTEEMTWRHLNFFQHEAYLHARVPRVSCTGCGIRRVPEANRYLWRSLKTRNQSQSISAVRRLFHSIEFRQQSGLPYAPTW